MKNWKRLLLALLLALLVVCTVQAREAKLVINDKGLTESVMTMRVKGRLVFDTEGKVRSHTIKTKVDDKIAEYLDKVIAGWVFEPYMHEGRLANVDTAWNVTLGARSLPNGSYEISIDRKSFGDQGDGESSASSGEKCAKDCIVRMPRLPEYPSGLAASGVNGGVMVHLYLNPDGTVADAIIAQSALYNIRGEDRLIDEARQELEKATLGFAKRIRFSPGSGDAIAGDTHREGALPVSFTVQGVRTDNIGKWRLEQRSIGKIAPWMVKGAVRWVGVSDTDGSGLQSMSNGPYRLREDAQKVM